MAHVVEYASAAYAGVRRGALHARMEQKPIQDHHHGTHTCRLPLYSKRLGFLRIVEASFKDETRPIGNAISPSTSQCASTCMRTWMFRPQRAPIRPGLGPRNERQLSVTRYRYQ